MNKTVELEPESCCIDVRAQWPPHSDGSNERVNIWWRAETSVSNTRRRSAAKIYVMPGAKFGPKQNNLVRVQAQAVASVQMGQWSSRTMLNMCISGRIRDCGGNLSLSAPIRFSLCTEICCTDPAPSATTNLFSCPKQFQKPAWHQIFCQPMIRIISQSRETQELSHTNAPHIHPKPWHSMQPSAYCFQSSFTPKFTWSPKTPN